MVNGRSQRPNSDPQNKSRSHRQLGASNDAELSTSALSPRPPPPKPSSTASRDLTSKAPENMPQEYGEGCRDAVSGSELQFKPQKAPVGVLMRPLTTCTARTPVVTYSKHDGVMFQPSDAQSRTSMKYPQSNRKMARLHPDSRSQASSGPKTSHHHRSARGRPSYINCSKH